MSKADARRRVLAKTQAGEKPELTKSANKPLSLQEASNQRAAAVATNRWATIKEIDGAFDKDPRREVINISVMDPNMPPEISEDLVKSGSEQGATYSVQQIGPGVIIGMREGGEFESSDGFGWKDLADKAAHGNPVGAGAARLKDVEAA